MARRAVGSIAASATGGTSYGVELGLRVFTRALPLLALLGIIVMLSIVGALAGFTAAQAGNTGPCSGSTQRLSGLSGSERQRFTELGPIYVRAADRFQLGAGGWAYLAAINKVETDFGLNLAVSSAGAVGWMQFEPTTFAKYEVPVPGATVSGAPDPYDPYDAIYAAANMLHANGAPANWGSAIFAYNHAQWYVQEVTALAVSYLGGSAPAGTAGASTPASTDAGGASAAGACAFTVGTTAGPSAVIAASGTALAPAGAPRAVQAAIAAGNRIIDTYYSTERDPGMLNAATTMSSYDCSGSTDFILYNAGLSSPQVDIGNAVAGDSKLLESYGDPRSGQWITIYANHLHVFIEVAGIVMDTAWYAPVHPTSPSSGPRWQPASIIPAQEAGDKADGFVERHPPGL
jgi:hypothetical protein